MKRRWLRFRGVTKRLKELAIDASRKNSTRSTSRSSSSPRTPVRYSSLLIAPPEASMRSKDSRTREAISSPFSSPDTWTSGPRALTVTPRRSSRYRRFSSRVPKSCSIWPSLTVRRCIYGMILNRRFRQPKIGIVVSREKSGSSLSMGSCSADGATEIRLAFIPSTRGRLYQAGIGFIAWNSTQSPECPKGH